MLLRDEVPNPTVDRQILHQMMISNGRYSKRVLGAGDTSPAGEYYGWLIFLEETVLAAITDATIVPAAEADTALAGLTYPASMGICGYFSDIEVTSGTVICYTNVVVEE